MSGSQILSEPTSPKPSSETLRIEWPLATLRQFAFHKCLFKMETGRKAPYGEGHYLFRLKHLGEFRQTLEYHSVLEVLKRARRQHQDWFDDNNADISNLLAEKNGLHKVYTDLRTDASKAAFFRSRRLVPQWLWEIQDAWMFHKVEKIQRYADRNEIKKFFKTSKAIYGPCIKGTEAMLSSDGTTLLTDKSQILKRWAEHFRIFHIRSQKRTRSLKTRSVCMDTTRLTVPHASPDWLLNHPSSAVRAPCCRTYANLPTPSILPLSQQSPNPAPTPPPLPPHLSSRFSKRPWSQLLTSWSVSLDGDLTGQRPETPPPQEAPPELPDSVALTFTRGKSDHLTATRSPQRQRAGSRLGRRRLRSLEGDLKEDIFSAFCRTRPLPIFEAEREGNAASHKTASSGPLAFEMGSPTAFRMDVGETLPAISEAQSASESTLGSVASDLHTMRQCEIIDFEVGDQQNYLEPRCTTPRYENVCSIINQIMGSPQTHNSHKTDRTDTAAPDVAPVVIGEPVSNVNDPLTQTTSNVKARSVLSPKPSLRLQYASLDFTFSDIAVHLPDLQHPHCEPSTPSDLPIASAVNTDFRTPNVHPGVIQRSRPRSCHASGRSPTSSQPEKQPRSSSSVDLVDRSARLCHLTCGVGDGSGDGGVGQEFLSGSDSSGTTRTDYIDICRLQTLAMNELLNSTS
ncbi:unnamed protein product [Schistocephalus solidus]|uniref:IRS-type PTB domain-containing protein n=1 Tax=Schistocephalus solidus TaxID=70667 RepID=A0A3P7CM64_SCHSO|nr:unnamed protein product [Schistocephalus solidus]